MLGNWSKTGYILLLRGDPTCPALSTLTQAHRDSTSGDADVNSGLKHITVDVSSRIAACMEYLYETSFAGINGLIQVVCACGVPQEQLAGRLQ